MANFCPTCKGLMRPQRGTMVCMRCTRAGRGRTVFTKGRRITMAAGQMGLDAASPQEEPALKPRKGEWVPKEGGEPHPQLGWFPHQEIRGGQRSLTRDITLAMSRGAHVVAQAPTGLGKTAASLAPAVQYAVEHGKTVMFLTSRQSQHRIAVETLRLIQDARGARFTLVDLVSKRDMCIFPKVREGHSSGFADRCAQATMAARKGSGGCPYVTEPDRVAKEQVGLGVLHVEELMDVGMRCGVCPHILAMETAKDAEVVVADYNHLFSDIRDQSLERLGLDLNDIILIVDEAHNLPDRVKQNHTHRVTPFLLEAVEREARAHNAGQVVADVEALRKTLMGLASEAERSGSAEEALMGDGKRKVAQLAVEDLHDQFERNRTTLSASRSLSDVSEDLVALGALVRKRQEDVVHSETLQHALDDWGRFRTGALRYIEWEDEVALHIRLLDSALPAGPVFSRLHASVLMSGTLEPPEMIRDILGLGDRAQVKRYPSPFPPEHRMTVIQEGLSTRFKERTQDLWDQMAAHSLGISRSMKGNMAIFSPSYKILTEIQGSIETQGTDKELLVESREMTKGQRDQIIGDLEAAKEKGGAILLGVLGGSLSEGVDYANNLLGAVVIAGLPLAPPDLQSDATVAYLERLHPGKGRLYGYIYPAMNKVLQAMGRGIRGPNDKCAVLLLDERYKMMPYRGMLGDVVASREASQAAMRFVEAHGL